jgi:glycosyltransferase involved in cell wall biosynthesis
MRVLFVAPYVPSRIRVRPYEWIRALARQGARVHLVAVQPPEDQALADRSVFEACAAVDVFPLGRWRTLANGALALPTSVPIQAAYARHPAAEARIRELLDGGAVDVVHVEHLRGALLVPAAAPVPTVYDGVDCITRLFEQTVRLAPGLAQRSMARLDVGRTRRFESRLSRRFDRMIASSEAEARAFRALDPTAAPGFVTALRNGVDLGRPPGAPADDGRTVLFAGKLSYHANDAAARRLALDVMPRVWQRHPEARLVLAGKDPSPALQALAAPGRVEVTGYVEDMAATMERATVLAAPLVYAAGIQNKVLEAMARGVPVVTSAAACAALEAEVGRDLVAADDDAQFADAIGRLLEDRAHRDAVGAAGRRHVERHHDWDALARALLGVYAEARQVFERRRHRPAGPR